MSRYESMIHRAEVLDGAARKAKDKTMARMWHHKALTMRDKARALEWEVAMEEI